MAGRTVVVTVTADISLSLLEGFPQQLVDRGWQVHVVCSPGANSDNLRRVGTVAVHALPMMRDIALVRDLCSWIAWIRVLHRLRPQAIMAATPKASLIALTAASLLRIPVRVHLMYGLRLETALGVRRRILAFAETITAAASTGMVAVSDSLAARVVELGITRRERVRVLGAGSANGVDIVRFSRSAIDPAKVEQIRGVFEGPPGRTIIGFVGRLALDKGVADLVAAVRSLNLDTPIGLLVVGVTEDANLADALRSLGDDGIAVHLAGGVSDVAPYFAVMDLLVLPSYREGFPTVILEAGAMGVPVIATDIVGNRDAVAHGKTGLLVNPREPAALAEAIRILVADRFLRQAMGSAGRDQVESRFDRDSIQKLYVEELERQVRLSDPLFQ